MIRICTPLARICILNAYNATHKHALGHSKFMHAKRSKRAHGHVEGYPYAAWQTNVKLDSIVRQIKFKSP